MDLGAWISDHQVCWDLRPRYEGRARKVVRAGFQLELSARGPTLGDDPGSTECHVLHEALVEVARLALPPQPPARYVPFDHSFHLTTGHQPVPEIEMLVDIGPFEEPMDAEAERALLHHVEGRLRRLGVPRRGEPPPHQPAKEKPGVDTSADDPRWMGRVA